MPGENDYVSRGKRDDFEDDSSHALGLSHGTTDAKGRTIVTLPEHRPEPDPNMVGMNPDQLNDYLEAKEDERDGNNIEKLMKEAPGGFTPGSHSSSGSAKKPKPGSQRKSQQNDLSEGNYESYRPHTIPSKISDKALAGIRNQVVSSGIMLTLIGEMLYDGTSWAKIEFVLKGMRDRKAS